MIMIIIIKKTLINYTELKQMVFKRFNYNFVINDDCPEKSGS